jgi:hypothetical protein
VPHRRPDLLRRRCAPRSVSTAPSTAPATRPGASFVRTLLVGIASAGLAVVASGSVWAVAEAPARARAVTQAVTRPDELAGADLVPVVVPLTLLALACWGAVLVLRRRGRRVVSVLGAVAALAASAATVVEVAGADDLDLTAWPWVVAGAAAVSALALVRAWLAAPGWPEMSSRYDRRDRAARVEAERPQGPADLWRALDEGRDPTA